MYAYQTHIKQSVKYHFVLGFIEERSGSVVKCSTRDWGVAGSSLTGSIMVCPWAGTIYPLLILLQPSESPDIFKNNHKKYTQSHMAIIKQFCLF